MKTKHIVAKTSEFEANEDDVLMKLDENSSSFLLSSLTHLYSVPVLAALREYFANAMDAHKDSGTTLPIEVDFLNIFRDGKKFLQIIDHGLGMSLDELIKCFQFGASTRRKNNATRGGFGLGAKSGLAVADHFYVTTVKDGTKISALILKDLKKDCSVVRILSEETTTEEPGTTILLPLTNIQQNALIEKAEEELSLYHPDLYLLNGKRSDNTVYNTSRVLQVNDIDGGVVGWYKHIDTDKQLFRYSLNLSDEAIFNTVQKTTSVGIGGVYYPTLPAMNSFTMTEEIRSLFVQFYEKTVHAEKVVLNLPIGSVSLPPHRDLIIDDHVTWATLIPVMRNFLDLLDTTMQFEVEKRDLKEAVKFVADHPVNMLKSNKGVYSFMHHNKEHVLPEHSKSYRDYDMVVFSDFQSSYRGEDLLTTEPAQGTGMFLNLAGGHTYSKIVETGYRSTPVSFMRTNFLSYGTAINYTDYNSKRELVRIHLIAERYYNVFEKGQDLKNLAAFLKKNVPDYVALKHGDKKVLLLVSEKPLPEFYTAIIDEVVDLETMMTVVKESRPKVTRNAVVPTHVFFDARKYALYHEVQKTDKVFFFGGNLSLRTVKKGAYTHPATDDLDKLKRVCSSKSGGGLSVASQGWVEMVPDGYNLVMVDLGKSVAKFRKDIPNAKSFSDHAAKVYNDLSEVEKEAVHHAMSMFQHWQRPERIYDAMLQIPVDKIRSDSIKALVSQKRLYGLAGLLAAFNDPNSPSYTAVQERVEEAAENQALAGVALAPVYSLYNPQRMQTGWNNFKEVTNPEALTQYVNLLIPA